MSSIHKEVSANGGVTMPPGSLPHSTSTTKAKNNIAKYETYFRRTEINEEELAKRYSYQPIKSQNVWYGAKKYFKKHYRPSLGCLANFALDRVPFCRWIAQYNVREDFVKDLIAGITIGIIQIPQGMAYSLMAGLPPIIGLYVTFFTVLVYSLLGTSRHLSLGIYAIVSLMVKSSTEDLEGVLYPTAEELEHVSKNASMSSHGDSSGGLINEKYLSNDPIEAKIMIGASLALLTGIIQVAFAILHVGFVTKYLSDIIVAAFTTGAAYHIVTSQINILLGLKVDTVEIAFVLIGDYIQIFSHIAKTNFATLIISVISMVVIYCVKHFINERYKAKLIVPVPIDLIVIVTGTILSYFLNFKSRWNVATVGDIPVGMPAPRLPPLRIFSLIFGSSINIAIVSFAINISMGKLFSKKYKYVLDSNQELFAYGAGNVVSSFFLGFPSCVGLSRSVILDSVGAKTQVYAIISSVLVLIVIVAIGPYFQALPTCCLGAIIVVALITLIVEIRQGYYIFKRSKFEALAWLVTFLGVIILDVDYGLYIGLCFSLLLIIFHSQRALTSVLGNIPYTDIYESIEVCDEAKEFDGIKIIRYEASVYYANVEYFVEKINKLSEVSPTSVRDKINKIKADHKREMRKAVNNLPLGTKPSSASSSFWQRILFWKKSRSQTYDANANAVRNCVDDEAVLQHKIDDVLKHMPIHHLIIDFSCVNFIDSMGVNAIIQLNELYSELGITLHLTYCKRCIFRVFEKNSFKEKFQYEQIYPTIHDAVLTIHKKKKSPKIRLVSPNRRSSINIDVIESMGHANGAATIDEEGDEYNPMPKYKERRTSNVFDDIAMIKCELPVIGEESTEIPIVVSK